MEEASQPLRVLVLEPRLPRPEPDLAAALCELGFHAEGTSDPRLAAELCAEPALDVLVLRDDPAPGPRASDLDVREFARRCAVVVLLSKPDTLRALELLHLGADEVLAPPFEPEAVELRVHVALHRRRRVRAAGEVERQLRAVVTGAPVVLWAVDVEGRFTLSEGQGLKSLGLEPGEVAGRSVFDLYAAWPSVLERVRKALAGVGSHQQVDLQGRVFDTHYAPLRGTGGGIEGVIGVSTDVTERARALEDLERRASFERLLARISTRFIHLAPDEIDAGIEEALARLGEFVDVDRAYVCTFDRDGLHLGVSHEWCAPGIPSARGDFLSVPTSYFPWLLVRIRALETVQIARMSDLPPEADETRHGCQAQGIRSMICVPLAIGADVLGFGGFVTMSEERAWTEEEVRLARMAADMLANALARRRGEELRVDLERQLREAQRLEALGTLAGGVAHDFNNLLTGILGYASLLRQGDLRPAEVARATEVIEAAAERAAGLTAGLLGFARQETPARRAVDLHAVVCEVMALLSHTLDERVEIELELTAEPHRVPGDPARIQQVVLNLLVNARDALPQGGRVGIETRVLHLDARACERSPGLAPGRYLELQVWDTGPGVPAAIAERVFEPFFTTKPRGHGTGMGLATVYGAVQAHGGAVRIEERPGGGALFRVHLPLHECDEAPAEPGRSGLEAGAGSILLVDDEALVRVTASSMLSALGYGVVEAADGEEALRRYASDPSEFDLVLLDLVMPGHGGLECLRRLRELDPDVRVLLSSGFDFGEATDLASSGAVGFVAKPYHLKGLAEAVRSALAEEGVRG